MVLKYLSDSLSVDYGEQVIQFGTPKFKTRAPCILYRFEPADRAHKKSAANLAQICTDKFRFVSSGFDLRLARLTK